mgnify:CR=1 FL=1
MLKYFRYLSFYFLALTDATVNFVASIVGMYPKSDIGTSFLINRELVRIGEDLNFREEERSKKLTEAGNKVDAAKKLFGDN